MRYKTLLKKLSKLSEKELNQEILLFYADGGTYSEVIDIVKTKKDNEILGCEEAGDPACNCPKGQIYLIHT